MLYVKPTSGQLCKIPVISRLSHKLLQKQPRNHKHQQAHQTAAGTSTRVYTLPIVLSYLLCSPGITAHWKLSLFDCWGLMEVACKKHNLCITYGACKGWRHVGIYGSGLLSPGFHIFGGDCADVHGLYCRVMQTEKLLCFVSAGPQTETSSRPNSCSRISHTSKHSVETAYTKWYKCANLHIICAGFPAGFEQCATAHIQITQTTEHRVLCTLLLCSSCAAVRFVSNIHISLICIQGPSRCECFRP